MDRKRMTHLGRKDNSGKNLGFQRDKNRNLPMDSTRHDSNANFVPLGPRKTISEIREKNKDLGTNKSAFTKVNPEEAKKNISSEALSEMSKAAKQDKKNISSETLSAMSKAAKQDKTNISSEALSAISKAGKPDKNISSGTLSAMSKATKQEKKNISTETLSAMSKAAQREKKNISSETLSAMSKAAKQDRWIEYNSDKEDLNSWLKNNPPSQILRSSGVGWISISVSPVAKENSNSIIQLEKAWETLTSQRNEITITDVKELASRFSMTAGKWLLHVNLEKVDETWRIVATALHSGQLGPNAYQAKVSPVADMDDVNNDHVISVYNKDFTDEDELLEVEASLRQAGLRCVLQYKPHIFSALGVFRNNRWSLRPTIYLSKYEMNEQAPIIESVLEKTWFWNNAKGFGKQEVCRGEIRKLNPNIKSELEEVKREDNDKIIDRPCNFFNDVGECKFQNGHLSKSGYTRRIHICRQCFNMNGQEKAHSELRCPIKSGAQQKTITPLMEIKDENHEAIANCEIKVSGCNANGEKMIARPCDYFNDTGSCKYNSGHLSKSGFTKRVHICRLCFSRHGDEKPHPETQCDIQMKDNTRHILSVINSLNQLKMIESTGRSDDRRKDKENMFGFGKDSQGECARTKEENERKDKSLGDKERRYKGIQGENIRNGVSGENEGGNKKQNESTSQGTSSAENEKELNIKDNNVYGRNLVRSAEKTMKNNGEPQGKSFKRNRKSKIIDEHNSTKDLQDTKKEINLDVKDVFKDQAVKADVFKDQTVISTNNNQVSKAPKTKDSQDAMKKVNVDVKAHVFKDQAMVSTKNNQVLKAPKKTSEPEEVEGSKKGKVAKGSKKEKRTDSAKESPKTGDSCDQHKIENGGHVKDSKESSMNDAINSLCNLFKSINSNIKVTAEDKSVIPGMLSTVPEKSLNENQQKSKEEKHDAKNTHENKRKEVNKFKKRGTFDDKQNSWKSMSTQENWQAKTSRMEPEPKPLPQEKLFNEKPTDEKTHGVFSKPRQATNRTSLPQQPMITFREASTGKHQAIERSTNFPGAKFQENHSKLPMNPPPPKMKHFQAKQNVERKMFHPKSELKMFQTLPPPPQFNQNFPFINAKGKEKRKPSHCPCPPYCPSCLDKSKNDK